MIELKNIDKIYKLPSSRNTLSVLNNINFSVKERDFISIKGSSGTGKTTLLNIIAGLVKPTRGSILLNGLEVKRFFDIESSRFRSNNIGFVFQNFSLISYHNVLENVSIPLKFSLIPRKEHKEIALNILDKLGIADKANYYPEQLSGGQQQKVAIARAIVKKPKLILADEPTGNLDEDNANNITDIFLKLNKENNTAFVVATHNTDIIKQSISYKLENNSLYQETT